MDCLIRELLRSYLLSETVFKLKRNYTTCRWMREEGQSFDSSETKVESD